LLLDRGLLTQEQLAEALIDQHQSGGKLGAVLIRMGHLSEIALAETLSEQLRTSMTRVTDGEIDRAVALALPREAAERHLALPMKRAQFGVLVAMADPLDMEALNRLEAVFADTIEPLVATETDVRAAIARVYGES
jgi:type IV pilus assembly protein PilB